MITTIAAGPGTDPAPAEATLMARVAAGDAEAFEAVCDRHARAVHSYAQAQLGRAAEAEEICRRPSCPCGATPRASTRDAAACAAG